MTALLSAAAGLAPLGEAGRLLGALDVVAPLAAEVLPGLAPQIDAAQILLPAAVDFVRTGWDGAAALGAETSLAAVGTSLADLGASGVEIGTLTAQAVEIVVRGALEVAGIAQGFAASAGALLPTALTPAGQVALVGLAADALSKALAVVERVRGELAGPTARMWQIAGEVNGTAVASVPVPSTAAAGAVNGLGSGVGVQAVPAMWSPPLAGGAVPALPTSFDPHGETGSVYSAAGTSPGPADGATPVTTPSGSVELAPNPKAAAAVEAALSQTGVGYVWGGQTPGQGFDCSGLTQWAYREAGVDIPRTAIEQDIGRQVSREELAPGDLLVWDGHVAMYVGDNQIVEAGDPVSVSSLRTDNIGMGFHGYWRPSESV